MRKMIAHTMFFFAADNLIHCYENIVYLGYGKPRV